LHRKLLNFADISFVTLGAILHFVLTNKCLWTSPNNANRYSLYIDCCIRRRNYSDWTYLRCCPVRAWIWLRCL